MTKTLPAALLASCVALAPTPVLAKGCIRGMVAGGVAGHYAHHHAIAGAMAGCAAGHYYYKHKATVAARQQTTTNLDHSLGPERTAPLRQPAAGAKACLQVFGCMRHGARS